jgi:hypothetical protein
MSKWNQIIFNASAPFSTNPKVFWSTKIAYNGITAKSSAKKAELLNLYFTSVFTKPSVDINGDEDEYEEITNLTNIGELQMSVQEVKFSLEI